MKPTIAYVDEGWTWRVPAVACICNLLVIGYFKSFGILMISFKEERDARQSHLMLVLGMNVAAVAILAPIMQILGQRLTSRALVFSGGLLIFAAMTTCSCLPHPAILIVFLGIVTGLGCSCAYTPSLCINGLCFRIHRASAAGLTFAGASLGQILFPLLLDFMTDLYTLRGCLLILGAIFAHLCVLGLLLPSEIRQRGSGRLLLSQGDAPLLPKLPKLSSPAACLRLSSFGKLRHLLPYLTAICLSNYAYTNQYSLFAVFASEHGLSRRSVTHLIIVQGVTDLVFRLTTGPVADRLSEAGRTRLLVAALVLQGAAAIVVSQCPVFEVLLVYSIVYGLTGAIYMTLWTVVLTALVGPSRFGSILSKFFLFMGVSNLMLTSLMSFLLELSNTAAWSILATGLAMCLAGILIFPFALQHRPHPSREEEDVEVPADDVTPTREIDTPT